MNIVFAKHDNCDKEFCFEAPEGMTVNKGDILLVDTMHGNTVATATTGIISGEGAKDIALKAGAYFPLKKVLSCTGMQVRRYIEEKVREEIIENIRRSLNNSDLPF